MSERKVLNKYYPPDFDPLKIPRLRLPKDRQYIVRLMAPCNMKCKTCGEYIYKGKKFNARKETVQNEDYLGIKVFRFYIKCPRCLAEITFKTDPQNADYIVEHGATRNFQALKLAEDQAEREAKDLEEEEKNNPMKLLENRTKASKQEMELIEALEDLKDLNQRQANVNFDQMLQQHAVHEQLTLKKQEEEDEAFIRSVFANSSNGSVKRIIDDDSDEEEFPRKKASTSRGESSTKPTDILTEDSFSSKVARDNEGTPVKCPVPKPTVSQARQQSSLKNKSTLAGLIKRKPNKEPAPVPQTEPPPAAAQSSSGLSLLGNYSDSD